MNLILNVIKPPYESERNVTSRQTESGSTLNFNTTLENGSINHMKHFKAVNTGMLLIGVLLLITAIVFYFSGRGLETSIALALIGSICGFAATALSIANSGMK